jgi:hypothetical protein
MEDNYMDNQLCNYFDNLLFKLKIYESPGDSFQTLFSTIMGLRNSSFRHICAYGRKGDGGNDGYIPSEKRYYQVYGPDYSGNYDKVVHYARKKLVSDFYKISRNWGKPKCFHFVYNDYFKGIPQDLINELNALKADVGLIEASIIDAANLFSFFLELDHEKKALITIFFPFNFTPSAGEVDSNAIARLVKNISERYNPYAFMSNDWEAPDFDKKILMNGLGRPIHDALRLYSRSINLVDDFLNTQPGSGQTVAFEMQKLYAESVEALASDIEDCSDLRFLWIAEKLLTKDAEGTQVEPVQLQAQRTASLVIMAKYFESCDIYEHPECFAAS